MPGLGKIAHVRASRGLGGHRRFTLLPLGPSRPRSSLTCSVCWRCLRNSRVQLRLWPLCFCPCYSRRKNVASNMTHTLSITEYSNCKWTNRELKSFFPFYRLHTGHRDLDRALYASLSLTGTRSPDVKTAKDR